ncbi:hypothetical protein FQN54_003574 [Arachnomyces sp. PD_36]|nr:hypothetical protein FQN54_003574 [Arachnomyces sp. PD_36]
MNEHLQTALQETEKDRASNILAEKRKRALTKSKCALLIVKHERMTNILRRISRMHEDAFEILKTLHELIDETHQQRRIIFEQKFKIQHCNDRITEYRSALAKALDVLELENDENEEQASEQIEIENKQQISVLSTYYDDSKKENED